MNQVLRTFWFSATVTAAILVAVTVGLGPSGLFVVAVLTILEITFSFDNAVVNAKLLGFMSPWWQRFFMTFGILIAVFVVRFTLPVVIVAMTAGLSVGDVLKLAFNDPAAYGHELEKAAPAIDAFGGVFLLMIAAGFFLDAAKDVHWFKWLERRLSALGRYDNVAIFVLGIAAIVVTSTIHANIEKRFVVLIAAVSGILLNVGLGIVSGATETEDDDDKEGLNWAPASLSPQVKVLVGSAAFFMFMRLEVLDASFSFDGVVGAFAISSSVIVIMAGLGAGALWVRSLTVYLVRARTLEQFRYLEHGAHWAIGALGVVMIVKLYGIDPPEWVTGSLGLVFIAFAVWSSVRHQRTSRKVNGR